MSDNRALVTGASRGLGNFVATRLAEQGWSVTGLGRRPARDVDAAIGFDYVEADLSTAEGFDAALRHADETFDLVVHCATTYPRIRESGPVIAETEEMFRVNATAPYHLTRELLARKPDDRFSSVIMVNSEAIFHADHRSAAYAASKAALRLLTAGLAESCRSRNASVASLVLGPLADTKKITDLRSVAQRTGMTEQEVTRVYLRKSNPDLVIDEMIDYESCFRSVQYINDLGRGANGMMCRLDGGSAGSLI